LFKNLFYTQIGEVEMKKAMKLVFILSIVAFLFTGCAPAAAATVPDACKADKFGCASFAAGEAIKIGMGAPMTGGNASYGIDISQGAIIAASDAGDVQGWKFALDAQDDQGNAEGGAAVANKFVTDPAVVAIAGHIFTDATRAAMPIYEKAGIPMLSPSNTVADLTTLGSAVFNRIAFSDTNQGNAAADYLFNKLNVKNLALLHDGSSYGKGLADTVAAQFTKDGGTVVMEQAITPGETDYTAVLSTVAAKNPDALYFGGYTAEGAIIETQMKQTGLDKAIFFGDDGTYGTDFLARTGAEGEGAFATIAPASPDSAAKDTFNKAYLAQFGKEAGSLSPYTWAGYDSAAILIAAVKKVAFVEDGKLYVPRTALMDAVRATSNYVGLSGTFTCTSVGECNAGLPQFVVVKNGAWVPAE